MPDRIYLITKKKKAMMSLVSLIVQVDTDYYYVMTAVNREGKERREKQREKKGDTSLIIC